MKRGRELEGQHCSYKIYKIAKNKEKDYSMLLDSMLYLGATEVNNVDRS